MLFTPEPLQPVVLAELGAATATAACAKLLQLPRGGALLPVATAAEVGWLPQVAAASRTAGRAVAGYILLGAVPTGVHSEWPDAPVVLVGDGTAAAAARLRGWRFVAAGGDPATDLAAAIALIDSAR